MHSLNYNCETGEETLIDLSAAEIAEVEARIKQDLLDREIKPTIDQKLASVGLSLDDLKGALGL
jgi:hypothetical protein